ncbi:MAG TPA: FG-GAP repeat protein [Vicinamibacterales bacterium]|nr:FG-GAP repeat protein [Vicinamibacterales bacterium]
MIRSFAIAMVLLWAIPAPAQTPREAPQDGYGLHDERSVGPFTIQRWVNSATPGVSPAGMCDCITVVYAGARRVTTFGRAGTLTAFTASDLSGTDVNGDGFADLVVSAWSGGAHCCYSSAIYSVGENVMPILVLETGNCGPGELEDLDGNGTLEFITCDDQWAYAYCSFADSPLPRVIYSYDRTRGMYVVDTPRFASSYREQLAEWLDDAQAWMSRSGGKDLGVDKCRLLRPALGLMYSGRFSDGVALIRGLYRGDDREEFEREVTQKVRGSRLWVDR